MSKRGRVGIDEKEKQVVGPAASAKCEQRKDANLYDRELFRGEIGFRGRRLKLAKRDPDNLLAGGDRTASSVLGRLAGHHGPDQFGYLGVRVDSGRGKELFELAKFRGQHLLLEL